MLLELGNSKVVHLKVAHFAEEVCATSISYQVQTGHRHKKREREKRMLIGISIRMLISQHTQYGKVQTRVSYGKPGQDKVRVR